MESNAFAPLPRGAECKLFVVCEHHEYSDVNVITGIFLEQAEAEDAIRKRGEVLCWRAPYFMPFALVWAQVKTTTAGNELVYSWCWIEEHTLASVPLPLPKSARES